jgi:hypothetical protein
MATYPRAVFGSPPGSSRDAIIIRPCRAFGSVRGTPQGMVVFVQKLVAGSDFAVHPAGGRKRSHGLNALISSSWIGL